MRISTFTIVVAALCLGAPARAQDAIPSHPALTDKFYFGAGVFIPKTATSAQLDSSVGVGTNIDFEQALGMTTQKTVPDAFFRWRFSDRWRVEAEYFQLNRSGDQTVDRQIQWGNQTFNVGDQVQSKFNFSDIRVSVGYSFFRTADKELGVGLGLHAAGYDVSLSSAGTGTEATKVLAPLPVLSVYGQFALTDRWAVGGRLDRFSMSYSKYDGNVTSMALDLNYQPFRHVGFGLAYRSLYIILKAEDGPLTGKFLQTFQGPLLYVNGSF